MGILPVLDQFIIQSAKFERFTASGDSICCRQLHSTVLKLTCSWVSLFLRTSINVAHVMNAPRPSPFFAHFCFRVLLSTKIEVEKWGNAGKEHYFWYYIKHITEDKAQFSTFILYCFIQ